MSLFFNSVVILIVNLSPSVGQPATDAAKAVLSMELVKSYSRRRPCRVSWGVHGQVWDNYLCTDCNQSAHPSQHCR